MRQLLNTFTQRLLGRANGPATNEREADELRDLLAARTRELDDLRRVKDQELQSVWDHAHKLNQALQQLDTFVRSGGHATGTSAGSDGHELHGRAYEVLAHSFGSKAPVVPSVIVPDLAPTEQDVRIAERLLRAYHRATAEEARRGCAPRGDSWAWIKTLQADFFGTLSRNDPSELAAYLCAIGRRDATIGTDQGNLEYDKIQSDRAYRDLLALRFKDKLLSLAEAVGAVACENPEQGPWGSGLHAEVDALVEAIERTLGVDITPPPIDGGLLKIPSTRGLFCERDCQALFTAWNLRQVLGSMSGASLCEIGAGSGRVAYWSRRLGCASYTIFDLPHINVIQGYYLLKSLSEDRVVLHGEPRPSGARDGTTVLPYFCMDEVPARTFDLVLNQDSFPEIQDAVVRGYLTWIKTASRRYFYSLNHESKPLTIGGGALQLSVPELVAEVGGYRRVSRTPYWLRRGYVAELYTVQAEAG